MLTISSLFLLAFTGQQAPIPQQVTHASTRSFVKPDSTTLIFKASPREGYELYMNTYYNETIPPINFKNKQDSVIRFYFDKPVRVYLMDNLNLPTTSYHVTPGETVVFSKNSKNRTVPSVPTDSIRTNELTFFLAMNQALNSTFEGFDAYRPKPTSSSAELVHIANAIYKKHLAFLATYQRQRTISTRFAEYMKAKFETMRYRNVLDPFAFSKRKADEVIRQFYVANELRPVDSTYIDERAATYARYTVAQSSAGQTDDLIKSANVVVERFTNLTRDYTLFQLISSAFIKDPQAIPTLVKQFNEVAQDTSLLSYVTARYKLLNTPEIDKQYHQSTLVATDDDLKTWASLLTQKKNRLVYVDFWASWCGPCRAEMPSSRKLRTIYAGKNIDFVYISVDTNPLAWKQAMRQIGIQDAENYILPGGNKSILAKSLELASIPKYLLIKDGIILLPNAPRPGDPALQRIINKEL